jgi:hypothetical protein
MDLYDDLDVLLSLACILPILEIVHSLIKFFQGNDNFICDFVSVVKIYQPQLYSLFVDPTTKFQVEMFYEDLALLDCVHESITLNWIPIPKFALENLTSNT